MKKIEKIWRLVAQINKYRTFSQELKHEPTDEDVQKYADEIDCDCEITVEVFWKKCYITQQQLIPLEIQEQIERKDFQIDELQEKIKSLKDTCIKLSKRATYTEDEKGNYWEFECKCGFTGLSMLVLGGGQIADTGDFGDCYCPCCGNIAE